MKSGSCETGTSFIDTLKSSDGIIAICMRTRMKLLPFYPVHSQPNLYPTVGLQTPGEVVDANFGQNPFIFDIDDMVGELRVRVRLQIVDFPPSNYEQGHWQCILHR
ncbi:hypothetical protein QAD02_012869 [Eretmocerus hayati]|uniref:Uncharacterized protein n=1 Tax=Eretmocerus hayati TaxID=131215 RepID=A0ACC2P3R7_9HYME|nr:hypothetical protein QAD02_012869 [Eretmocerus hayati]